MNDEPTKTESKAKQPQTLPAVPGEPHWMVPADFAQAMKIAEFYSASSMVPKNYQNRPADVLVAMSFGESLGLGHMAAMMSLCVINGMPSLWGDAALALVRRSGLMEDIEEHITEDGKVATCTVKRRGDKREILRTFTMDDAKRARLLSKAGPWQDYPQRMLRMRARSWALRDAFPDVLRGLMLAEEAGDIQAEATVTVAEATPPKLGNEKLRDTLKQGAASTTPPTTTPAPEPKADKSGDGVTGTTPAPEPRTTPPPDPPGQQTTTTPEPDTSGGLRPSRAKVTPARQVFGGHCVHWTESLGTDHPFVVTCRKLYSAANEKTLREQAEIVDGIIDAPDLAEWITEEIREQLTNFVADRMDEIGGGS